MSQKQDKPGSLTRSRIRIWIKVNWIWFVPLILALLLLVIWLSITAGYHENRMTETISLDGYGSPDLAILIQHPSRLSTENVDDKAKRIVILPTGIVTDTIISITLNLEAPAGVVNFLNGDRISTGGNISVDIDPDKVMPVEIGIEHAQTKLAEELGRAHITTSLELNNTARVQTPELDFDISLETTSQRLIRLFVTSPVGGIAPIIALAATLAGGIYRVFVRRRRIEPLYSELQSAIEEEAWPEAIKLCDRIIEIDPSYDSIEELRLSAKRELRKKIDALYGQAIYAWFKEGDPNRAIIFLKQILRLDETHEQANTLLQQVSNAYANANIYREVAEQQETVVQDQILKLIEALEDNRNWQTSAEALVELGEPAVYFLLADFERDPPTWRRIFRVLQSILDYEQLEDLLTAKMLSDNLSVEANTSKALAILRDKPQSTVEEAPQ